MKTSRDLLTALAGAVALAVSVPVLSQGMGQQGMGAAANQPGPRPDGTMDNRDMHRGDMRGGDMHRGDMRGGDMHRGDMHDMQTHHQSMHRSGWSHGRRHCHWTWRHHHRVRVCHRG